MYFRLPCYGNALNCHVVHFAIPGTRPLFIRKQNAFVLIIRNRKKNEFKSVQINMKQVLYASNLSTYLTFHLLLFNNTSCPPPQKSMIV